MMEMLEDKLSPERFEQEFNQFWKAGKYSEALVLAHEYAHNLDIVADFFSESGDYESAEAFYLHAQQIYRPLLTMHPDFALSLNNLAQVYYYKGAYKEAESLYQETLEVRRALFGESHTYVAAALNNLAQVFSRIGQYEKAEPLLQQALEIRQQCVKEVQDDVAESLDNLAMLKYRQGRYQEAEPLFLQALELRRTTVGEQDPGFATILNNLSLIYETRSDYRRALAFASQASDIWRATLGEEDTRFASSLNNIGVLYQNIGDYKQAEEKLRAALKLRREILPPSDSYIGDTLSNLALLCQEIGRYPEAEQYYREALDIYRSLPGDEHFEIAQSLDGLASLLVARGDYKQAAGYYEQALEMMCRTLGNEHPNVARCLNSMAVLYKIIGQYGRAQETLERGLRILQPLGTDHPLYMLSLDNLAALQYAQGNYAQAEAYYQQALSLRRAALGEGHSDVAQSLNNLAVIYRLMGDNAKAQDFYIQALQVTRTALGEQHPDVAVILNNLAFLYNEQGDFTHEAELLQQVYDIWTAILPDHHPYIGTALDSLAAVQQHKGDYILAQQLFEQALAIRRAAYGNQHLEVALSLNNLAVLSDTQGEWGTAELLYQEALAIQQQSIKNTHPDVAQTLRNLANLYAATQRYTEALAIVQQAATIDDQTIGQIFSIGSENQRLLYMTTLQEVLDGFLALIVQHLAHLPEAAQAGFDLVLRRKALGAEALLVQRDAVLCGRYPALKSQIDRLTMLRSQIGRKILEGPESAEQSSYQDELSSWRREQEDLESELAHKIPEMDIARSFQRVDRRTIAQALPDGSCLVEFVYLHTVNFRAIPAQNQEQWQPAHYIAFVLKAYAPETIQVVDLGEAVVIDELINDFRSAIIHKEPLHAPLHVQQSDEESAALNRERSQGARTFILDESERGTEQSYAAGGILLRRAIFDPLLPALADSKRLLIAADGDLSWVPFAVLPHDDGRYLIDDYQITYLTTARDLLRSTPASPTSPGPALVIADPNFDLSLEEETAEPAPPIVARRSSDIERGLMRFKRLPGAQLEGEQIAALLHVSPLIGAAALDAHIKSYHSPFILHIATHGFFLPDQPHSEGIQTMWEGIDGENSYSGNRLERLSSRRVENPLLRSGLVVAGVNTWSRGKALQPEAEDGLLPAEDVANMDLTGTELVVLSACETGLGHVHIGEGIFGLRRAFTIAGAKTLVMSLWKVDDQQTRVLMLDFYTRILQGQSRAEALREAQITLKKSQPHPYYWGAFICQGVSAPLPALPAHLSASQSPDTKK